MLCVHNRGHDLANRIAATTVYQANLTIEKSLSISTVAWMKFLEWPFSMHVVNTCMVTGLQQIVYLMAEPSSILTTLGDGSSIRQSCVLLLVSCKQRPDYVVTLL